MRTITLPPIATAAAWRDAARGLASAAVPPEAVDWRYGNAAPGLFDEAAAPPTAGRFTVPRAFVELAERVCWHSDPERFARLYGVLWRLRDQPGLIQDRGDPALAKLRQMEKSVGRDIHKMRAFLRFREVGDSSAPRRAFAAWFEPEHHIVEPNASFFQRRFGDMDWLIVTPDLSARFEAGQLTFEPGRPRPDIPEDATEALWTTYFRNIFNPARLKVKAMQAEMPKKYWKNMPEAREIPDLIASAEERALAMRAATPTQPPAYARAIKERPMPEQQPPAPDTLAALHEAARGCTRCDLYRNATQVVVGEGSTDAEMMFVGEQPGDQEDLAGRPFVGPAGRLFDEVVAEAGIDRSRTFVTNAVKHFKFAPRGKRRIHQRPDAGEIQACRWWLEAERRLVQPLLIVALGATAAESLTGTGKGILKRRGTVETAFENVPVFLTVHPSYLLRLPDADLKAQERERFRQDLAAAQAHLVELRAT
ncbi:UdgX family uracil-DNA binding protein [Roseitranquillus sediminis]|uniref:UdgX family uracil-DNA binding protein n=1 Tax=Roseitranquillus sediminis TaxID=2809051 RepID=UPI001D0BF4FB|nr:UdgX family uracil-DNA binding protein [Roseitranquillus sediminis]MBM9594929.1 UdgX family uracil-DNA binding protein [Roseitranquillus sediminis]